MLNFALIMISDVLKDRMEVIGLTQAKLAEAIGCTPTQLSLFFKGEASLNRSALDKCFKILGISFETLSNRIALAKRVADHLKDSSIETVVMMSRTKMMSVTMIPEITAFPEVTKEEFDMMVKSRVADYESTFPYFKAMVLYFKNSPEKQTPKTAEKSLIRLASALIAVPVINVFGIGTAIGAVVGALATKKSFLRDLINTAWGPILAITYELFDKKQCPVKSTNTI